MKKSAVEMKGVKLGRKRKYNKYGLRWIEVD
jgi:hypothetical protein